MVAHNASFDRRYWMAELARAGHRSAAALCLHSVALAPAVYPEAPSHKLGSLVSRLGLPQTGAAHRALADAEMAAELLVHLQNTLRTRHGVGNPDHAFLRGPASLQQSRLPKFFARCTAAEAN